VIVADTCVVLWLAKEPEMLSKAAGEAIRAARKRGGLAISGVTLYEIAWLARKKRVLLDSIESFLSDTEANFIVLPVTGSVSRRAAELPDEYPSDPMDRIIGGTALDKGAALVTKDRAIRRSKAVEVIW
jgi:PIN domain nuclease of toxin-antitoxin system